MVSEGVSPQAVDFGRVYLKTAYDQGATVAFDTIKDNSKSMSANADTLGNLKGILKTAAQNGYKTGLVTTEDALKTGAMFYGTTPENVAVADFGIIAGGGRANAGNAAQQIKAVGGTAMMDVEGLNEEPKGKVLALQADHALTWNLDRDGETESGFGELVTLALQTLSADDQPFFLIVHDTLLAKALNAKDTPAALEQFKELDGILGDIAGTREGLEKPEDFAIAVLTTGGALSPKFTTELPNERAEALYIVSALPMSYAKAGTTLKGADEAKLKDFAANTYKGWMLKDEVRGEIVAGKTMPESAIRASYEPALRIAFEPAQTGAMVWASNLNLGADVAQSLQTIAATKPAK
ncbi:MAG TPA: hypothetical protein VGB77_16810 [Abditibacteriaceae bacterium]